MVDRAGRGSFKTTLCHQICRCPLKGHLFDSPVPAGLAYRLDSLPVGTNSSSIQPLEHFILTSIGYANTYKIDCNRYINFHVRDVEQVWYFVLKYQQLGVIK